MATTTSNRGRYAILGTYFLNSNTLTPPGFKMALVTAAGTGNTANPVAPTSALPLVWSDISANEVPAGNGYVAGGQPLTRTTADWVSFVEDDTNNRAIIALRTITWTATGGNLPASGTGAAYAVLYDTTSAQNVLIVYDLGGNRVVSATQQLILQNFDITSS